MVKTLKKSSPELKFFESDSWYKHWRHKVYHFCSNADPRMTFDLFTALSIISVLVAVAMLHGICRYAVAVLFRLANHCPWATCFKTYLRCSPSGLVMAPEFGSGLWTNMATVSHLGFLYARLKNGTYYVTGYGVCPSVRP